MKNKLTTQEYADQMISDYAFSTFGSAKTRMNTAIRCALIDIQRTIDANPTIFHNYKQELTKPTGSYIEILPNIDYYQEVKKILESKL